MKRKLFARIFRKGCDDNESWNRWVRVTESKQIMEVQFVFNTSTNLWWKSELKVITQQDQLKCSQRDWNCKAKFVHTSKIIKVGTQTDVRDFLLKNFAFFLLEVVWLRSVSRSTILKFLDHAFAQIFTSVEEKNTCFASYLSTNQSRITNFEKKFHGRSRLPYYWQF